MSMRSPMSSKLMAAAVFATAAVLTSPAQAQQRLSLAERVDKLEQQSSRGGAQGSVDLVNQIQELQSQLQVLQGQIEELKHQLGETQRNNKAQYIDLDSRIGRIEGGGARGTTTPPASGSSNQELEDIQLDASTSSSPANGSLTSSDMQLAPSGSAVRTDSTESHASATTPSAADPAAEKRSYDEAFAALKDGRYAESARRFQSFIDQYPNSDLTGNAYYWLGESYYVTQNYRVALDTFNTLLARFPANQKAPDAMLKTGYCQYELKQWDAAETTLTNVSQTYPDTTVSRLAQGRLRALKLENRR